MPKLWPSSDRPSWILVRIGGASVIGLLTRGCGMSRPTLPAEPGPPPPPAPTPRDSTASGRDAPAGPPYGFAEFARYGLEIAFSEDLADASSGARSLRARLEKARGAKSLSFVGTGASSLAFVRDRPPFEESDPARFPKRKNRPSPRGSSPRSSVATNVAPSAAIPRAIVSRRKRRIIPPPVGTSILECRRPPSAEPASQQRGACATEPISTGRRVRLRDPCGGRTIARRRVHSSARRANRRDGTRCPGRSPPLHRLRSRPLILAVEHQQPTYQPVASSMRRSSAISSFSGVS
jgi:hypothetical protein